MKILITGVSGSGKSAVGRVLKRSGYDVIDTDQEVFNNLSIAYWLSKSIGKGVNMPWPPPENWHIENDWVWRINILRQALAAQNTSVVFACGDARNKEEAYTLFDKVLVLSVDDDTISQRIQSREDNHFGKSDSEFAWIIEQNKTAVKNAMEAGGIIIDATRPLDIVVKEILEKIH